MKVRRSMLGGVLGALAMSLAMFAMRSFGVNVSLEALLGSVFAPADSANAWILGFIAHLTIGAIAGLVYALGFEVVQRSGALTGAGLGLAHGMLAGLVMSAIPAMNPLDPSILSAPGPFLSHEQFGPAVFFLVHVIFGMVVGLTYGETLERPWITARRAG